MNVFYIVSMFVCVNVQAKENAWHLLARDFRSQSQSAVLRTSEQLKACWKGIKKSAKLKIADEKVRLIYLLIYYGLISLFKSSVMRFIAL